MNVPLRPNGAGHEKNCADAIRTFIVKLSEILDCSADELLGLRERNAVTGTGNRRMLRLLQRVLAATEREKGTKVRSLSPPRGALRRIGTVAS